MYRSGTRRAAVLLGVVLPGVAGAAVPANTVELQISSDVLVQLVEDRVRTVDLGCPVAFDGKVVNHLAVQTPWITWASEPTTLEFSEGAIPVHTPAIVTPITVHLKDLDCVHDPACPLDATDPVTVYLEFGLRADEDEICASYLGPWIDVDPEVAAGLQLLTAEIGEMCSDIDLGTTRALLGGGFPVQDVALSASPLLDRLAVRLEVANPLGVAGSTLANWEAFLDGDIAPNNGAGFSLFVDERVLQSSLGHRVRDGMVCGPGPFDLSDPGCTDEIEPSSDAATWWDASDPSVQVWLDAEVYVDECPIPTVIGVEPLHLFAPFELAPGGDAIEMHGTLDFDLDDLEVAECVAPLWVFTAMPFELLSTLEGMAESFVSEDDLSDGVPSGCTLSGTSDLDCTFGFELPRLELGTHLFAELGADSLVGHSEGLLLEGWVWIGGWPEPAVEPLTLGGSLPYWHVEGGCSSGPHLEYSGSFVTGGSDGLYCADPETAASSPYIAYDPLDVYNVWGFGQGPPDDATVYFDEDGADAADFWNYPSYPLDVTVFATTGAGTISLGTPQPMDEISPFSGPFRIWLAMLASCFAEETGLFGIPGLFDFHWLIDPPPYEVVITGTDRGWLSASPTATLSDLVVTQLAAPRVDAGTVIMDARTAQVSGTVRVDGGSVGSFTAPISFAVPVGLIGVRDGVVDGLMPQQDFEVSIAVPRGSLPAGVRSATMLATFGPESFAIAGRSVTR